VASDGDKEPDRIDYEPLRVPIEEIPSALVNRIARERGQALAGVHPALPEFLEVSLRISDVTWRTIKSLCADKVLADEQRLQFAISVPPLARTLLDSLFTIIYLFDEPAGNTRRFLASGWRELLDIDARLRGRHGQDPEWDAWLGGLAGDISRLERHAAITADERKKPKLVSWWPNPGKMGSTTSDVRAKEATRASFLAYLNDWFYKHLSGDSHLSFTGLARRGGRLLDPENLERTKASLTLYRSEVVFDSLTIFMALLSEISGQLKLDHEAERLRLAWSYLSKWPSAHDLYEQRYRTWLAW
jgi:hypothetical protein